ncbi:MAG: Lipopolysaccharide core heptosyltransferase RfaQ [Syntrophus sp. PtaB.Bin001]|nr:MAG: Lipopolysaccharide core heptosyltransferase RfaQ [Syntrophus sp. PtaB.Bin001]
MINGSPRILVIKLRYLGDVLLTTPVFGALRAHFPEAFIAAAVNRGTETMLTDNPAIDRIFTVETDSELLADIRKQFRLIKEIRSFDFDTVLDLTWSDRAAVLSFLSGAKKRFSYKPKRKRLFSRSLLFTDLIDIPQKLHTVKRHLAMATALGCPSIPAKPTLYWSSKDGTECEEIMRDSGLSSDIPYVVIHPTSNAIHKVWTTEGYAAVCDYLSEKKAMQTILVCGKDEKEARLNQEICSLAKSHILNFGGRLSLKQLAVLLSKAVLFIGIDSGPMHMATAVDTPVLAIFGPSRPWRWGPCGSENIVIQKKWDCVPCGKKGCRNDGRESRCLSELTPDEVIPVIESKLAQISRQHSP